MSHIFISFHSIDVRFVSLLIEKLREEGDLPLWVDAGRMNGPVRWTQDVEEALRECQALVVVISPEAKASDCVTYEWVTALALEKPVIPILFRHAELHPRLAALPYLDFRTAPQWEGLIRLLRQALSQEEPPATAPLEPPAVVEEAPPPAVENVPSIVRRAEEMLDSLNPEERETALENLVAMDHPAARDVLARAANSHPSRDVRIRAAKALESLGDVRAVPGLLEGLYDSDHDRRWDAAWSLVRVGGEAAIAGLLEALHDAEARRVAAWALGEIGEPAREGLTQALYSSDPMVRLHVSEALVRIGPPAIPALLDALRGENDDVRTDAARALGQIGPPAVEGLVEALRDEKLEVRRLASEAIEQIGERAVPGLIEALHNPDWRIGRAAAQMLRRIGTEEARAALDAWRGEQGER